MHSATTVTTVLLYIGEHLYSYRFKYDLLIAHYQLYFVKLYVSVEPDKRKNVVEI